jgi:Lar family restriction alleviation protein
MGDKRYPAPCPFCGGNDLDVGVGTKDREGFPAYIICADCGAQGPLVYMPDKSFLDNILRVAQVTGWDSRK